MYMGQYRQCFQNNAESGYTLEMKISLIAAMDKNNAIGVGNTLPWHVPTDMQHFRKTTSGRCIFMGRKTFDSMGKALPKRTNYVLTRDDSWAAPDTIRVGSLQEAAAEAQKMDDTNELWVIGGAQVYEMALPYAHALVLTRLDIVLEQADAYFPAFSMDDWLMTESNQLVDEKTGISLVIETWTRKASPVSLDA